MSWAGFTFASGKNDPWPQAVLGIEEQSVESIFDVGLGHSSWSKFWVGVSDLEEEMFQGPAKLHGLVRRVCNGGIIHGRPSPLPGVVAKEVRLSFAFFLDGSGGQHQLR